jgi:hypothetical protein
MELFTPVATPPAGTLVQQLKELALKGRSESTKVSVEVDSGEALGHGYIRNYMDLERDLSETAKRVLKNLETGKKYDRVFVLGVYWHESIRKPVYISQHADELLKVFHEEYGYEVKTLVLNKEDAYKDLDWALAHIGRDLERKTQENLFILYYGGHGGFGKDRSTRLWQSSQEDAAESVDWYKLQGKLGWFHFDILFLFDCCYAMAMPTEGIAWRKRCEIVGAAGEREKAGGKSEISFTAALTTLLRDDLQDMGYSNAWRLSSVMQSRDYKTTLRSTPQRRRLARGHASIALVPLSRDAEHTPSSGTSSSSSCTEFERMLSLLPLSVKGLEVGLQTQTLLDVIGMFQSNSGLTLMSVSVWFWNLMDSNPAYRYIDVVRSDNILEEYREKK